MLYGFVISFTYFVLESMKSFIDEIFDMNINVIWIGKIMIGLSWIFRNRNVCSNGSFVTCSKNREVRFHVSHSWLSYPGHSHNNNYLCHHPYFRKESLGRRCLYAQYKHMVNNDWVCNLLLWRHWRCSSDYRSNWRSKEISQNTVGSDAYKPDPLYRIWRILPLCLWQWAWWKAFNHNESSLRSNSLDN